MAVTWAKVTLFTVQNEFVEFEQMATQSSSECYFSLAVAIALRVLLMRFLRPFSNCVGKVTFCEWEDGFLGVNSVLAN